MTLKSYKIRKMRIDNNAELHEVGKRCGSYCTQQEMRIGGLYFINHVLYRIEGIIREIPCG